MAASVKKAMLGYSLIVRKTYRVGLGFGSSYLHSCNNSVHFAKTTLYKRIFRVKTTFIKILLL
ncbi:MAG: hypothetical protein ACKOSR_04635, partial [Flavobacteriales bacterium]